MYQRFDGSFPRQELSSTDRGVGGFGSTGGFGDAVAKAVESASDAISANVESLTGQKADESSKEPSNKRPKIDE